MALAVALALDLPYRELENDRNFTQHMRASHIEKEIRTDQVEYPKRPIHDSGIYMDCGVGWVNIKDVVVVVLGESEGYIIHLAKSLINEPTHIAMVFLADGRGVDTNQLPDAVQNGISAIKAYGCVAKYDIPSVPLLLHGTCGHSLHHVLTDFIGVHCDNDGFGFDCSLCLRISVFLDTLSGLSPWASFLEPKAGSGTL